MARQRYPSDDKRLKQRPHAKVHLSIRSHPRYAEALEDPEMRGVWTGLLVLAVQYHAAQTDDEVTLGHGDLVWCTGRAQRRHALSTLRALCELMDYPMREEGKRVVVKVRNLQQKQGFNSATPTETPHAPPPSEEPKNQGTKEPNTERERTPPAPSVCRSCGASHPKGNHRFPAEFSEDQLASLKRWSGSDYSADQIVNAIDVVRDWAEGGGKRKACWVATIRNAMRDGWALRSTGNTRDSDDRHRRIAERAEAGLRQEKADGIR